MIILPAMYLKNTNLRESYFQIFSLLVSTMITMTDEVEKLIKRILAGSRACILVKKDVKELLNINQKPCETLISLTVTNSVTTRHGLFRNKIDNT